MAFNVVSSSTCIFDAWANAWNQISSGWGQVTAGTLAASWTPGTAPAGGAILLQGVASGSPTGTSTVTWTCSEAFAGVKFALRYLAGPGFGQFLYRMSAASAGAAQASEFARVILGLWKSIAADLCGASFGVDAVVHGGLPTQVVEASAVGTVVANTAADCWPWSCSVVNAAARTVGVGNQNGYGGLSASVLGLAYYPPPSQQTPPQLPDIETSVNNGSAIWSITSSTLTEP